MHLNPHLSMSLRQDQPSCCATISGRYWQLSIKTNAQQRLSDGPILEHLTLCVTHFFHNHTYGKKGKGKLSREVDDLKKLREYSSYEFPPTNLESKREKYNIHHGILSDLSVERCALIITLAPLPNLSFLFIIVVRLKDSSCAPDRGRGGNRTVQQEKALMTFRLY